MKRVALFGSAGQLGQELAKVFKEAGYAVTGFAHSGVDISDAESVAAAVTQLEPALVINAAAYNQVDRAEEDPLAAMKVNGLAVGNLARASRVVDAKLIHYSTDYVFDGETGRPYREEDPTHPLGAYAISKLTGELFAQAYLKDPLVIRTCGVYGPAAIGTTRGNFVEGMLRAAEQGKPLRVVEDHVASPTFAPALARRTLDLVEKGASGTFHIGGGAPVSWYEWARMIFAARGLEPELKPTNGKDYRTPARRPKYSALSNAKMESLGIAPMPKLEVALEEYFRGRAEYITAQS